LSWQELAQVLSEDERNMPRRCIVKQAIMVLTALTLAPGLQAAHADSYPQNKITIIVAFAPGGFADTMARLVAQGLSERLRQSVVVENRAGGGGNIAAGLVARAAADGYTLLATTTALAINETLSENKPFSANDFKTVAMVASSPEALATSSDNPAGNVSDFIKAMHGKVINFGSAGVGTGSHIQAEYFFRFLAKVPAQHVPFQGGAPAVNAAIGNQIDLLAATLGGGVAQQMQAGGKLKGLGIAADQRAAVVPHVPSYAEQGFPDFKASSWVGIFAPAKTDPQILATLNGAINDIVKSEDVRGKLIAVGYDPIVGSQTEMDSLFRDEVGRWGKMVRALDLSIK
jgi:tripartite-type tricarboxylate transporter receptor subunit TctC